MQESSSFKQYRTVVVCGMTLLVVLGLVLSLSTGMSVSIEALLGNVIGSILNCIPPCALMRSDGSPRALA